MIVYIHNAHLVPILCNCKHFNIPCQCFSDKTVVYNLAQLNSRKRHSILRWMSDFWFHRLFRKPFLALAPPQQCIGQTSHLFFF